MKILDLFCSAGGSAMGMHQAFPDAEIVGVDIAPQKHYPFRFAQSDAMTYPLDGFDFIWASPPCQAFTDLKSMPNAKQHSDLLTPTRARLIAWGGPSVIENVEGAPMRDYITLCGTMFGLGVKEAGAELRRHRRFEIRPTAPLLRPMCQHSERRVIGVYGGHGRDRRRVRPAVVGVWGHSGGRSVRDGTQQFSTAERAEAMQISWMTCSELSQAIPPAYSRYILTAYRAVLEAAA